MAFLSGTLTLEQTEEYKHGILLGRITPVLAQLAFSLREYKNGMTQFALELDAAESNRTPNGLAELFGRNFPPGAYEKEMEQASLKKEAMRKL